MSGRSARPEGGAHTAPVFAALGDQTRLALVSRLCAGRPLSIAQLTAATTVTRQAITKHLHVLAHAGLVLDTRQGRERIWRFQPNGVDEARLYLDTISKRWDAALDRLRRFVEE